MIKLYHFPASPYGWIARMALAEKGLTYESSHPYDRKDNPELAALNPINRTPTLVIDGRVAYESFAIMELLEEKYPEPALLPRDAFDRARARALTCMAYMDLLPEVAKVGRAVLDFVNWDAKAGGPPPLRPAADVDAKMRDEGVAGVTRVLGNIEKVLGDNPWMAGPAFTMADIAFTPFVTNLALRGYAMPDDLKRIAAWHERLRKRPSFAASKPTYIS